MTATPVILLGGDSNALSVARSLAPLGVPVFALNYAEMHIRRSRFCRWLAFDGDGANPERWRDYLLGSDSDGLRGAVLFPCTDEAIELVLDHRDALAQRFILEAFDPVVRACLLDKLCTYYKARELGVATPGFWEVDGPGDVPPETELKFPLIIKPRLSHEFRAAYGKKFLAVDDYPDLLAKMTEVHEKGLSVVLMEFIPGGDDQLCSYYTYLDGRGEPLLHFTKRVIRRYPTNMGGGTYHITDWVPEAKELGLDFFRRAGLRGLGNVEFKRDQRDGQLKLIECNARFTEGTALATASGCDMPRFVYRQLTGQPEVAPERFRSGVRLWNPVRDLYSFRELRDRGELSLPGWLASVARPQIFPYFSWRDPIPSLISEGDRVAGFVRNRVRRFFGG